MKKINLLCILALAVVLTACGSKASDSAPKRNVNVTDEDDYDDSYDSESEDDEYDEVEEESDNPLARMDTIYPGDYEQEDTETIELINCFIDTCPDGTPELSNILCVTAADFDGNGEVEAFIFVGEQTDLCYSGHYYYVDGTTTEDLVRDTEEATDMYSFDGFIDCGDRKYAFYNEYYTTAAVSNVYTVKDGKACTSNISCLGTVRAYDDGTITVTDSSYDCIVYKEDSITMGHSWKPYYFYYDIDKDDFSAYSGEYVNVYDIDQYCGFDLFEQIVDAGYGFHDALYRSNDILIVDIFKNSKEELSFYNISYDCKNKCFIETWDSPIEGNNFLDALQDGRYIYSLLYDDWSESENDKPDEFIFTVEDSTDIFSIGDDVPYVVGNCDGVQMLFGFSFETEGTVKEKGTYKYDTINNTVTKVE